ncbi:Crp/Fnr family transcriptional regulator [Variovorax sp. J31P207]|uniref:Crp/Fnr family transcriptional regulator n=1 Tax=Variovorax sp. J31P207 TaxID=3053510 RepID=UPI0025777F3D|nr:Crp/Fnr family transcriptional regulator [Variovorax sp. J31P207]MDM0065322.1 Crp/Fnr family transcriptional regulator [Variovorax sp. J31P207]
MTPGETGRMRGPGGGGRTGLDEMLDLVGIPGVGGSAVAFVQPTLRRLRTREPLFLEGGRASSLCVVRRGSFKVFRTDEGGCEQVFAFATRGDMLGCDALCGDHHLMAAVALEDASVLSLSLADFFALAQSVPSFYRGAMRAVSNAMIDLTRLSDMMAAVAAEIRLARFLVHLSRRSSDHGLPAEYLHLPMTRRDIGSYLGVAHETVSRSFKALADAAFITVDRRRVEILDFDALRRYGHGARAPASAQCPMSAAVSWPDQRLAVAA